MAIRFVLAKNERARQREHRENRRLAAVSPAHRVTKLDGAGPARDEMERELAGHGIMLPLPQRTDFQAAAGYDRASLFVVREHSGALSAAAGVAIARCRALPGHRVARIDRLSASSDPEADRSLVAAIAEAVRANRRWVRLTVDVFERDAVRRAQLAGCLSAEGFAPAREARHYAQTLALELDCDESRLFAGLSRKARRDIRQAFKRGLDVRPVVDPRFAPRLAELAEETFHRTGADACRLPWAGILDLSRRDSHLSRVSGVFDPAIPGARGLLAFAWGHRNGDCVTYDAGASTRRPDLGNTPLGYAPLWDLIAWAHRSARATWFDFGGVTAAAASGTHDPLSGISEFKRHFCKRVVDVSESWVLEPHRIRAVLARVISAAARAAVPSRWLPISLSGASIG